jgi:hypothetical protein
MRHSGVFGEGAAGAGDEYVFEGNFFGDDLLQDGAVSAEGFDEAGEDGVLVGGDDG